MIARILDPQTGRPTLVCGPHWATRCGAAGDAQTVACAGRTVLVDRETAQGTRTQRVAVSPHQRTCPFGPPDLARRSA